MDYAARASTGLVLAALVLAAPAAGALPDPDSIVFPAGHPEATQLYTVSPRSGLLRPLPAGPGSHQQPHWSPDGKRVAFAGYYGRVGFEIYVVDADGKRLRRLTRNAVPDLAPVWSPDGTRIAFVERPPQPVQRNVGEGDVMLINVDGSGLRRVTDPEQVEKYALSWSPDGRHLMYVGQQAGRPFVVVLDLPSSVLHLVTSDGLDPSWSPDGARIVFVRGTALVTIRPDGTDERLLGTAAKGFAPSAPAWSPDGGSILFVAASLSGDAHLEIVSADGTQHRFFIPVARSSTFAPAWSPDGKQIAFVYQRRNALPATAAIGLIRPDGSGFRLLARTAFGAGAPSWRPRPAP